jgi:2-O-A-mannosyl-D-glycerate-specific PTS system IIC component
VLAAVGWFASAIIGAAISTCVLVLWRRQAVKAGKYLPDSVMP